MSVKKTPPDKNTGWQVSFESTKSGAGLQILLLGRAAKAQASQLFFSDTGTRVELRMRSVSMISIFEFSI